MMHQSILVSHVLLIILFLFSHSIHADNYCTGTMSDPGNKLGQYVCNNAGNDTSGSNTYYVPMPTTTKRDVWDNLNSTFLLDGGYSYQVSPYLKPAAVLRECTGSVVTTYDTKDANLNGRGQTVVSQRNGARNCNATCAQSPIKLFSGNGASVNIIKEDIFFPGGVIHITDGFFTVPQDLNLTLLNEDTSLGFLLQRGLPAFNMVPSITAFVPSHSAVMSVAKCLSDPLGRLSADDARTMLNAQVVKGFVAYSPLLVDGAFFQAGNGNDITITVAPNGTKYANGIPIIREDLVTTNGVVHVIDGFLSPPPVSCNTVTQCSTSTTTSTLTLPPVTSTITLYPRISTITSIVTSTIIVPTISTSIVTSTPTVVPNYLPPTPSSTPCETTTTTTDIGGYICFGIGCSSMNQPTTPPPPPPSSSSTQQIPPPPPPPSSSTQQIPPPPPPPSSSTQQIPTPPPFSSSTQQIPTPPPFSSSTQQIPTPPPFSSSTQQIPTPPTFSSSTQQIPPPQQSPPIPDLKSSTIDCPEDESSYSFYGGKPTVVPSASTWVADGPTYWPGGPASTMGGSWGTTTKQWKA